MRLLHSVLSCLKQTKKLQRQFVNRLVNRPVVPCITTLIFTLLSRW
jgi:hypothetical protein